LCHKGPRRARFRISNFGFAAHLCVSGSGAPGRQWNPSLLECED
jgi:hypothetical protein